MDGMDGMDERMEKRNGETRRKWMEKYGECRMEKFWKGTRHDMTWT